MAHARAGDRRDAHDPLRLGRHLAHPVLQRVAQAAGQREAGGSGGQQLLGEERVATGAGQHRGDELRLGRLAPDARQLRRHIGLAERAELDDLDALQAQQLGEQRAERVTPMELIGPVGGQQQHRLATGVANEEPEEVACRRIGPMEVLQDEHQRPFLRQAMQDPEHDLEQAGAGRRGAQRRIGWPLGASRRRTEVGQQVRQLGASRPDQAVEAVGVQRAHQRSEGRDERSVREAGLTDRQAVSFQDERPGRPGAFQELLHQPRLADPRLAGDEARAGPAGRGLLERVGQAGELGGASDEDGTADARHGGDDSHRGSRGGFDHQGRTRMKEGMATADSGSPRAPRAPRRPRVSPRAIPMTVPYR